MKICIEAGLLSHQPYTGIENYTRNLIQALLKIVPDRLALITRPGFSAKGLGPEVEVIPHKPLKYPGRYSLSAVLFPPRCIKHFDLVHCPTVAASFFLKSRAKVIMTVHDLIPILFPHWHVLRRRIYFKYFLKYRFRFVDHFIAVSTNTKNDLVRCLGIVPQRISVIYEGVGAQFKPADVPKGNYILAVGTIEPRKNLRRVIEAFILLRKKHNLKHQLLIAGAKGWYCREDLKLMEKHRENIKMLGYVPEQDLPELYRKAQCLIYPSLYEGFGLPVIEAMACGCPVITSNLSSLPEIAGNAALLVNPYQTDALAGAIIRLLQDHALRRQMIDAGLRRSAEFGWDRCAEKTLHVYESVVHSEGVADL